MQYMCVCKCMRAFVNSSVYESLDDIQYYAYAMVVFIISVSAFCIVNVIVWPR